MYPIRRLSALAILVTVAVAGASTPPAYAAGIELAACGGTETVTYDPAVTLTPQLVTLTGKRIFLSCVTTEDGVTSATNNFSFQDTRSCLTLVDANAGELPIVWNDGRTSLVAFTAAISNVAGQVIATLTGTVIEGLFKDAAMVMTNVGPTPNPLLCVLEGISSRTGVLTLTLTSVP